MGDQIWRGVILEVSGYVDYYCLIYILKNQTQLIQYTIADLNTNIECAQSQ